MAGHVHTADNAVPPLDDDLAGLLEDLAAVQDPAIDQILSGLRLLALTRHTVDRTQTLIATLAGASDGTNVVSAIGLLIARLSDPDTNPALRTLPLDQQKNAALAGERACFALTDPELHQAASDTSAAIDGT
ncbi:hypothetical protein SAM23877_p011 (plasmid) [Streptomyces ambofaciens ATCC 23877]|uniref:Uncharacterized protein n=1 Tax=Streptomyces ambofaciens (strain ATCC 23877 / 3486 / DSM 40053 / JCM 4204 / NBRC 12836 / NRRL B-2516) TaxID=278992 RepID=A0A0K2B5N2_STRA7|nr:hypothetical protein [Streptomyces ambofaciens]AKZ60720.1 hypothetical protein SAM23877_p011 [Streptomyces ambofaciens ATCC 23877]